MKSWIKEYLDSRIGLLEVVDVIITPKPKGACSICREPGHYSSTCPGKPMKKPPQQADHSRQLTPEMRKQAHKEARSWGEQQQRLWGSK